MLSMTQIEKAAEQYLESVRNEKSFELDAMTDAVLKITGETSADSRHRVERDVELILAARDDFFVAEGKATARANFFKGCQIKIVPSRYELEQGFLCAGARFAFCTSPEVFPDEYELRESGAAEPFKNEMRKVRFGEISQLFLLMGRSGLIDHLVAESDENYRLLRRVSNLENAELDLSVYDLSDFYKKVKFQYGDALIATVSDWLNCRFTVEYQSAVMGATPAQEKNWIDSLEGALLKICEKEGDYQEIPEQLSLAWFQAYRSGTDLRGKPFLALEEYQTRMREIAISRHDSDWLLVPVDSLSEPGEQTGELLPRTPAESPKEESCSCGHNHAHEHHQEHAAHGGECSCGHHHHEPGTPETAPDIKPENFSASSGSVDSIDAILAELNAPLNYVELYAMTLDAMANGEDNFESFQQKLMDFMDLKFADDAQETAFLNFLEDDWEMSQEYFNPSQEVNKTPLRTRLLELTYQRIDISKRLLERFHEKVPADLSRDVRAAHRKILETLALLNADSELPSGDDFDQLELRIGDIEDDWDDVMERASSVLEP